MVKTETFDVIALSGATFLATHLLGRGNIAAAAAVLTLPLLLRGAILVADVFWTSFTGRPLIRAERLGGADVRLLNRQIGPLPEPLRRRRPVLRVSVFRAMTRPAARGGDRCAAGLA